MNQNNYSESAKACEVLGMRLFQMTSPDAVAALSTNAVAFFGIGIGSALWVDGLISLECQKVHNSIGGFQTALSSCDTKMSSFCERVKTERGLIDIFDMFQTLTFLFQSRNHHVYDQESENK
jgi:hypothetical protein